MALKESPRKQPRISLSRTQSFQITLWSPCVCVCVCVCVFTYFVFERERGRERIPSRLHTGSAEPRWGFNLTNREIVTWAKIKSRTSNSLSHPGAPVTQSLKYLQIGGSRNICREHFTGKREANTNKNAAELRNSSYAERNLKKKICLISSKIWKKKHEAKSVGD